MHGWAKYSVPRLSSHCYKTKTLRQLWETQTRGWWGGASWNIYLFLGKRPNLKLLTWHRVLHSCTKNAHCWSALNDTFWFPQRWGGELMQSQWYSRPPIVLHEPRTRLSSSSRSRQCPGISRDINITNELLDAPVFQQPTLLRVSMKKVLMIIFPERKTRAETREPAKWAIILTKRAVVAAP